MIRRQYFIRDDQDNYIRSIPGNNSETVRIFIDMGIKHDKENRLNISKSRS